MFITVGGEKPISVVKRKKGMVHFDQSGYTSKISRADKETMSTCQHKTKHM